MDGLLAQELHLSWRPAISSLELRPGTAIFARTQSPQPTAQRCRYARSLQPVMFVPACHCSVSIQTFILLVGPLARMGFISAYRSGVGLASAAKCGCHFFTYASNPSSACTLAFGRLRPRPSDRRSLVRVCRRQVRPPGLHCDGSHGEFIGFS